MAQFAGDAHWVEPSPLFAYRARPTPLKCKNEYPVLPLGEETAVQAVVGSIVWAFRRLKKPRCREMSVRGYALHSVPHQLSFFLFPQRRLMEEQKRKKRMQPGMVSRNEDGRPRSGHRTYGKEESRPLMGSAGSRSSATQQQPQYGTSSWFLYIPRYCYMQ